MASLHSANVWNRFLQTLAGSTPAFTRSLPRLKTGQLLLERGHPPQWQLYNVMLAGSCFQDVGLYYSPSSSSSQDVSRSIQCLYLYNASIESLEDVLMIQTKTQTVFWCAAHVQDAIDWKNAIIAAIKRFETLDIPYKGSIGPSRAKVDEFLNLFVGSTRETVCLEALDGALSSSRLRSIVWKVWLEYLPADVPFRAWKQLVCEKRQVYEKERREHWFFHEMTPVDFESLCETTTDERLHSIYKDMRRTRSELPFFQHLDVQMVMIRVLYVYAAGHGEISYKQGMGELLATILYLLHLDQWPSEEKEDDVVGITESESEDDSYLDKATFLQSVPFTGRKCGKYRVCCRQVAADIVQEVTNGQYIEHDAYLLLEQLMLRMAGAYGPQVVSMPLLTIKKRPLRFDNQAPTCPLNEHMDRRHYEILNRMDPPLANHLIFHLQVEPQIFLLRWIRVLFAREFPISHVWLLWDALFSLTPLDFSFLHFLGVELVRAFRHELLTADDSTTVLLKLRSLTDRNIVIDPVQLIHNAYQVYNTLLLATALEASLESHPRS